jgi:hypothetical protein
MCPFFAEDLWYLPVEAELDPAFVDRILSKAGGVASDG